MRGACQDAFSSASAPLKGMTAVERATSTDSGCNSVKTECGRHAARLRLSFTQACRACSTISTRMLRISAGLLTSRRNAIRAPRTPSLVLSRIWKPREGGHRRLISLDAGIPLARAGRGNPGDRRSCARGVRPAHRPVGPDAQESVNCSGACRERKSAAWSSEVLLYLLCAR